MNSIDRSAIPPSGDIEINREISARNRKSPFRKLVRITPKERSILQALNKPVTVSFRDSRFQDVIEYLSTLTGQPILLDQDALKEAEVNYDTPISLSVKGVSVRTVVRRILSEFGLTYIIRDEAIFVTSKEKAKKLMITRAYPVADLVSGVGPFGGLGLQFGPGIDALVTAQNVASLIQMITTSVDPDSWKVNSGEGTIGFDPRTMSLVIRQSAEVHSMLRGGLLP